MTPTITRPAFRVVRESGPRAGVTQFQPIGRTLAWQIADYHYDNVMELYRCVAGDWAVECPTGIVANVGLVDGTPAILHRLPGGDRQLCLLEEAAP